MTATLVNGKGIADAVLAGLREQIEAIGTPLHLAAVCVGDDDGIRAFVKMKQKAAHAVGIQFSSYFFDAADRAGAEETLRFLAADEDVHGIFIELPLPPDWDRTALVSLIPPGKDVDALTAAAVVPAPAVRALEYVLHEYDLSPQDLRTAVVGNGLLIGAPIAAWLRDRGATVDVIDIDTPEPETITVGADLVITGTGTPGLVTDVWVKEGAAVVDFGYAKKGADYVGDVDAASVQKKAGLLTPVPGGMGPLVVAAVLENLVELATR